MAYTKTLSNLIKELEKLPGIGKKTAERLGFHLLKVDKDIAISLANAIVKVKNELQRCEMCYNIADDNLCEICANPKRDTGLVCVVEQTKDLMAIEKTGNYQGVYHVLMGRLSPLENQHAQDTTLQELIQRVQTSTQQEQPIREVIIATNPNVEGDATALYIQELLKNEDVKISRIARGIPTGGSIEFANQAMLTDALVGRHSI